MRALRLRGCGAAASTATLDPATATSAELAALFAELDVEATGLVPVDDLIMQAKRYFDAQPTSQPETWIRSIILKYDHDRDGLIDAVEFEEAVLALRKC